MALPPKSDEAWHLFEATIELDEQPGPPTVFVVELGQGVILASEHGAGALKSALRKACTAPFDRRPRRPALLQVENDAHLAALRGVMPAVALAVAPRPALVDEALVALGVEMKRQRGAATGDTRPLEALAWAGVRLEAAAPWNVFDDTPIGVEAPELGLEHGALVLMGQGGESFGFLLFSSPEDAGRYAELAASGSLAQLRARPIEHLALDLERARDVEPGVRRALERIVGKRKRLAVALRLTRNLVMEPADERETRLLAAVADALAAMLGDDRPGDGEDVFEHGPVELHLPSEQPLVFGTDHFELDIHPLLGSRADLELLARIAQWCDEEIAEAYEEHVGMLFSFRRSNAFGAALVLWPRLLFTPSAERPFVAHFRDAHPLAPSDVVVIEAQARAWNGLWETRAAASDGKITAFDHITGEERDLVADPMLLRFAVGTLFCGRVAELDGVTRVVAADPSAIAPGPMDDLIDHAREYAALPAHEVVAVERARELEVQVAIVEFWEGAMSRLKGSPR